MKTGLARSPTSANFSRFKLVVVMSWVMAVVGKEVSDEREVAVYTTADFEERPGGVLRRPTNTTHHSQQQNSSVQVQQCMFMEYVWVFLPIYRLALVSWYHEGSFSAAPTAACRAAVLAFQSTKTMRQVGQPLPSFRNFYSLVYPDKPLVHNTNVGYKRALTQFGCQKVCGVID